MTKLGEYVDVIKLIVSFCCTVSVLSLKFYQGHTKDHEHTFTTENLRVDLLLPNLSQENKLTFVILPYLLLSFLLLHFLASGSKNVTNSQRLYNFDLVSTILEMARFAIRTTTVDYFANVNAHYYIHTRKYFCMKAQ